MRCILLHYYYCNCYYIFVAGIVRPRIVVGYCSLAFSHLFFLFSLHHSLSLSMSPPSSSSSHYYYYSQPPHTRIMTAAAPVQDKLHVRAPPAVYGRHIHSHADYTPAASSSSSVFFFHNIIYNFFFLLLFCGTYLLILRFIVMYAPSFCYTISLSSRTDRSSCFFFFFFFPPVFRNDRGDITF